jgi:hypothetical protein
MTVFHESKMFPKEETYSLTDQVRRSSRSIVANLAEGYRKRQYPTAFCEKIDTDECRHGGLSSINAISFFMQTAIKSFSTN